MEDAGAYDIVFDMDAEAKFELVEERLHLFHNGGHPDSGDSYPTET
jgi:hypothetical protein